MNTCPVSPKPEKPATVAYATAGLCASTARLVRYRCCGSSAPVLDHVAEVPESAFCVTRTMPPYCTPAQTTFGLLGETATAASGALKAGEMACQLCALSMLWKTCCAPKYSRDALLGSPTNGGVMLTMDSVVTVGISSHVPGSPLAVDL